MKKLVLVGILGFLFVVFCGGMAVEAREGVRFEPMPSDSSVSPARPVMERAVPEMDRPEKLPDLLLDVSCFTGNRTYISFVRIWNIDANGNELSICATKTTADDGRQRFRVHKGSNYKIKAQNTPYEPTPGQAAQLHPTAADIKEIYNIQECKAIALHLAPRSIPGF